MNGLGRYLCLKTKKVIALLGLPLLTLRDSRGIEPPLTINALEAFLIRFGACIKADWKVLFL